MLQKGLHVERHYHPPFGPIDLFAVGMDREVALDAQELGLDDVILNLGPGIKHINGAKELEWPEWNGEHDPMPYEDGSVDRIYALHFLEHLSSPVHCLRECQRVLRSGGTLNIVVPHRLGAIAYQDLDHKSFFTEDTWQTLFGNPYYDKDKRGWNMSVGFNLIMGLNERNLVLVSQLIKN